ncbi:MAG: hypothetical protein DMG69_09215 [Acidobacteria bacterium]|nr:MAG: hypothetical protein DMG69_09215 [Acidobacteriota bacterium]
MRNRTWLCLAVALVLAGIACLSVGCGSSNANIRLLNATPDEASLSLLVDGKSVASVSYGTASGYMSVSSGSRHLQVEPAGTSNPLIDVTATANSSSNLTLISLNYSFNISNVVLTDDNSAPSSGNFKLRIINASPGLSAQDVYVEPPNTNIGSLSPTISNLALGTASSYSVLTPGNYEVYFTSPGQKFINLDTGVLSFSAGQIRTLVALNGQSGGYTSAALTDLN